MAHFYTDLEDILMCDPGGRGLCGKTPPTDLISLTRSMTSGKRFFIITGFPIPECGTCETDGPSGAAIIARALIRAKKRVTVITDEFCLAPVKAAMDLFAPEAELAVAPLEGAELFLKNLRRKEKPSHIISIERPGQNAGHYYSMRGEVLDQYIGPTDSLFFGFGGVTIGIGDGGNELGMGNHKEIIAQCVTNGDKISADYGSNFPLVAGVSNWWGWGIAALLSVSYREDLLPSDAAETALLQAVTAAGAVDGITRRQELAVDGIELEEHLKLLREIRKLVIRRINR